MDGMLSDRTLETSDSICGCQKSSYIKISRGSQEHSFFGRLGPGSSAATGWCPSENKTLLWHIHTHSKIACKIEVNLCAPHPLTYYSANIKMSSESIQTSFIFRIIVILSIACKILCFGMFISGINFVIHNKGDFLKACPWSKAVIFLYRTWSCWISLERP